MTLYLVKFHNEHFTWYKRGHCKWENPLRRYQGHHLLTQGVQIETLQSVQFSTKNWIAAKAVAESIEHVMNVTWPCKNDKNIRIEQKLQVQQFDGMLDGSTEFIYLKDGQSEQDIIDHFNLHTKDLWKVVNKLDNLSNNFKPATYKKVK